MAEVTAAQGRYLSYILAYINGFGVSPAESEIAEALGVSSASVSQMMKTLEKKGHICRQSGRARSIETMVPSKDIPKWRGKRITRTVRQWVYVGPSASQSAAKSESKKVYRFKITLQDADPAIWRRIEIKDVTLGQFHELIQTAMGWTNSHMHQFKIADIWYTDPRFLRGDLEDFGAISYAGVRISTLVAKHGPKLQMEYEYDFGDSWHHDVELEAMTEALPRVRYPRCIDGARACPPENIGGIPGFTDYLEGIADPRHCEHRHYLRWNGRFDPAQFDTVKITRRMKKGLPSW